MHGKTTSSADTTIMLTLNYNGLMVYTYIATYIHVQSSKLLGYLTVIMTINAAEL